MEEYYPLTASSSTPTSSLLYHRTKDRTNLEMDFSPIGLLFLKFEYSQMKLGRVLPVFRFPLIPIQSFVIEAWVQRSQSTVTRLIVNGLRNGRYDRKGLDREGVDQIGSTRLALRRRAACPLTFEIADQSKGSMELQTSFPTDIPQVTCPASS